MRNVAFSLFKSRSRQPRAATSEAGNSIRTVKIVSALLIVDGVITCVASCAEYGNGANVGSATGGVMLLTGFVGFIARRSMA
jgi:hypothetical protein